MRPSRTSSPEMAGSFSFSRLFCFRVLVDGAGERGAEAGEMRAAVGVRDGVREAEDLVVVAVVVLERRRSTIHFVLDFDLVLVPEIDLAPAGEDDGFRMDERACFRRSGGRIPRCRACRDRSLCVDRLGALVDAGGFRGRDSGRRARADAAARRVELELRGDREDRRIRQEGDERAGLPFCSSPRR